MPRLAHRIKVRDSSKVLCQKTLVNELYQRKSEVTTSFSVDKNVAYDLTLR